MVALFNYCLRLGDTTHILSHRLAEWTGHGPALEEELATANTALDLLGQARMWLSLAAELEAAERDEDELAYLRDSHEYRNYLLVERANGHYGDTLLRQYFFDVWHYHLLQKLGESAHAEVKAIAQKSIKEVAYHVRRSTDLVVRLGDGTAESHERMQACVKANWRYLGELFVDDEITRTLAADAVIPLHASLWTDCYDHIQATFQTATLELPEESDAFHLAYRGGPQGRHTELLGYLLAEMQYLQRSYPGAKW